MSTHRLVAITLAFLAGLAIGWIGKVPATGGSRSPIEEIQSITVLREETPESNPTWTETRLRVDRVLNRQGNVLRERLVPADSNRPPWKLVIDGTIILAIPE
jgi:hypothetical protein